MRGERGHVGLGAEGEEASGGNTNSSTQTQFHSRREKGDKSNYSVEKYGYLETAIYRPLSRHVIRSTENSERGC